jgi:putative exosortase-associated protein (TIGR04073 family)
MTTRKRALLIPAILGLLSAPAIARADTPLHKAGRGLAGITTGFLEIPGNIIHTAQREGAVSGWTNGFAKGLGMCILRPPVGFYELITAPFPAPEGYKPILEPEYPWSYFGSGERSRGVARHEHAKNTHVARH